MDFKIHEKQTLMGLLQNNIREEWENVVFSDYGSAIEYTHKDVFEKIARMHILFKEYGVKRGDKIALCDKNSSNWGICFMSAFTYGAVVVPMLAEFSMEQIGTIVKHSDAVLLFTNANVFKKSDGLDKGMMIDVKTFTPFAKEADTRLNQAFSKMEEVFSQKYPQGVHREDVVFEDVDPESLALLSYTSGSTGNPKGVMVPYRAIMSNTLFARHEFPMKSGTRFLSILPLAHMFGFAFDFFYPYSCHCRITFLTKVPSPAIVLKAFKDVKPKLIISVPLVLEKIIQGRIMPTLRTRKMRMMLKVPGMKKVIYNKVRKKMIEAFGGEFDQVILGGAGVNREVDQLLHDMHFPYTIGYGMTETAPLICYSHWKKFVASSCGRAVHRMEIKILSDDPQRTPGEIVCRGANVMLGYYKNEEATNAAIDSEGWLHTGDLGTIDKAGNLFIRGRKKNMLLGANGQNIYPEEVEDKVLTTSPIDETVVVQRDQKLVALAYVSDKTLEENELTREQFNNNLDEYRRNINAALPKYSQLTAIEMRDEEFEKTPKRNIKRFLYK